MRGRITGAGLEVSEQEVKPAQVLIGVRNVVLAPPIAGFSIETRHTMTMIEAKTCIATLAGQPPPSVLKPEVLERS